MWCGNERERTILQFVIVKIASWIHSYFDNVMRKFMNNNRTDARKSDVNLLNLARALLHDVWICVRGKDAQKQLARTSLKRIRIKKERVRLVFTGEKSLCIRGDPGGVETSALELQNQWSITPVILAMPHNCIDFCRNVHTHFFAFPRGGWLASQPTPTPSPLNPSYCTDLFKPAYYHKIIRFVSSRSSSVRDRVVFGFCVSTSRNYK